MPHVHKFKERSINSVPFDRYVLPNSQFLIAFSEHQACCSTRPLVIPFDLGLVTLNVRSYHRWVGNASIDELVDEFE